MPATAALAYWLKDLSTATAGHGLPGTTYTGPVSGLDNQVDLSAISQGLSLTTLSNWGSFIKTGSGVDAIDATTSTGRTVIDAGGNSNFITGGVASQDTYFMDLRTAQTDELWDTITNFKAGDDGTLWGLDPANWFTSWQENVGAVGYTGLTLNVWDRADTNQHHALTFSGLDMRDTTHMSLNWGSVDGQAYLQVHG